MTSTSARAEGEDGWGSVHAEDPSEERIARARWLRKNLTPQEARLWLELRALRSQSRHFRRQVPFGGYFLDFVCFDHRVVVEVDGGGHVEAAQAEHDRIRDLVLRRQGFRTLRILNGEVNVNLAGVMETILGALAAEPKWRGYVAATPPGRCAATLPIEGREDQRHATLPPRGEGGLGCQAEPSGGSSAEPEP
ncbi:MAG: endonuclease domain-containing protein [Caulobacteraceae bacterium]